MLLADGDLRQSADLCKSLLDADPKFSYGYHLMSSLFHSTGTYDKALTFAKMAIDIDPAMPLFHFQHGQVLVALKQWEEAIKSFRKTHELQPTSALPLLLWADACTQLDKCDEAMRLFKQAREIENIVEVDEHEGLCLLQMGNIPEAEQLFDRVIERRPDYHWGYIHKGKLLMERKQHADAEACFVKAMKLNTKAHEALYLLALLHEHRGQADIAIRYAIQAIQVSPKAWPCHILLGNLLLAQNQLEAAQQVLQQAHELEPDNAYTLELLVSALRRQHKLAEALVPVDKFLALQPDNAVMRHFRAMLRGDNVDTAPKEYVSGLFDGYADRFDHHLQQVLSYKTPEQLAWSLRMLPGIQAMLPMSLLDLGCGTGLGAQALQGMTSVRVGVDLSEKMIEKARFKQLYSELHSLDIIEFMTGCDRTFDLVVATDVLGYIGNLSPFFKAVRNVMAAQGLLAFSIEKEEGTASFHLHPNGRYTHAPEYILKLAEEEGYVLVKQENIVVRMENYLPVHGLIYILKKAKIH